MQNNFPCSEELLALTLNHLQQLADKEGLMKVNPRRRRIVMLEGRGDVFTINANTGIWEVRMNRLKLSDCQHPFYSLPYDNKLSQVENLAIQLHEYLIRWSLNSEIRLAGYKHRFFIKFENHSESIGGVDHLGVIERKGKQFTLHLGAQRDKELTVQSTLTFEGWPIMTPIVKEAKSLERRLDKQIKERSTLLKRVIKLLNLENFGRKIFATGYGKRDSEIYTAVYIDGLYLWVDMDTQVPQLHTRPVPSVWGKPLEERDQKFIQNRIKELQPKLLSSL